MIKSILIKILELILVLVLKNWVVSVISYIFKNIGIKYIYGINTYTSSKEDFLFNYITSYYSNSNINNYCIYKSHIEPTINNNDWFLYNKTIVIVNVISNKSKKNNIDDEPQFTGNLNFFGVGDKDIFTLLFLTKDSSIPNKFMSDFESQYDKSITNINSISFQINTKIAISYGNIRKLNSVYSPHKETLYNDLKFFYSNKDMYFNVGTPWTRGCLLIGPPGTGKTSLIQALCNELCLDLSFVSISNKIHTKEDLIHSLRVTDNRTVLVLEDFDTCIPSEKIQTFRSGGEDKVGFNYGDLLNCLDGIYSSKGRYIFFTTNHPELLPKSMIRPGRIDLILEIGYCTQVEVTQMFEKFFPTESLSICNEYCTFIFFFIQIK